MTPREIMRRQRGRLGLTQADVANRVGMSQKNYQRIEGGHCRSTHRSLFVIAQVLQLPPDTMTGLAAQPTRIARSYWPTEKAYQALGRTPHPFPPNLAEYMESIRG